MLKILVGFDQAHFQPVGESRVVFVLSRHRPALLRGRSRFDCEACL